MDHDSIEFDIAALVEALKKSNTYEELRLNCDLANIECIIAQDEYKHLKSLYSSAEQDFGSISL